MYSLSRLQQVMQLLPWGTFDAAVSQHQTDRHCKRFTSRKHLLAMTCAQLSDVKSLRVLEAASILMCASTTTSMPSRSGARRWPMPMPSAARCPLPRRRLP